MKVSIEILALLPLLAAAVMCLLPLPSHHLSWRRRHARSTDAEEPNGRTTNCPKPPWVRHRILYFKALMPDNGCRKIAATFNAQYRHRGFTVSKSWVASVLKIEGYRLDEIRKGIRSKKPRQVPKNLIWGIDLTFADQRPVLGMVDHGTRTCISLRRLRTKAAIGIMRAVLDAVECFGAPRIIRTDNESMFTSRLFRAALWMLGIRHQRTAPFAPWQNGRIERFFGTLKERLRQMESIRPGHLPDQLQIFRFWYNHIRPHNNLDGRTPARAWNRDRGKTVKKPLYFKQWDGVLTGFYFPD